MGGRGWGELFVTTLKLKQMMEVTYNSRGNMYLITTATGKGVGGWRRGGGYKNTLVQNELKNTEAKLWYKRKTISNKKC